MTLTRPKREQNRPYLDWIRTVQCFACLVKNVSNENWLESEPHHFTERGQGGMGTKCPDTRAIPLCYLHHREIHQVGRHSFLKRNDLDEEAVEKLVLSLNKIWEEKNANR